MSHSKEQRQPKLMLHQDGYLRLGNEFMELENFLKCFLNQHSKFPENVVTI